MSVALAALAALLYTQLDNELVPDEDRGVITIDATGPDGVGIDFMDGELDEVEQVIAPYLASGEIESRPRLSRNSTRRCRKFPDRAPMPGAAAR